MRMKKRYAAAGLACIMALSAAGCTAGTGSSVVFPQEFSVHQYQGEEDGQVTVQSRATVRAVPDVAELSLSVRSEDKEAAGCQKKNEEALRKALEYLKSQGIEETSIQTSGYDLYPRYSWTEEGGQVLTGYEMNTQITVSGVPMEQVGTLLGGTVSAGVNSIEYVKYMCSDYDGAYQEALKDAVAAAKEKAEAMGEAGGFQVLEVESISEYGDDPTVRYAATNAKADMLAAAESEGAGTAMSVEAGELEIEAQITVSFQIKPR